MKNKTDSTAGYLYCIYNKMYDTYGKNMFKLGNMKNKNRMNSYVTPYIDPIEIKLISNKILDKSIGEKILFDILRKYRYRPNREFFQCDLKIIKKAFDEVESIFIKEPFDKLQELYNPMCKEQIINNMIFIMDEKNDDEDMFQNDTSDSYTFYNDTSDSVVDSDIDNNTYDNTCDNNTYDNICDNTCDETCDNICNNKLYDKFKHNNEYLEKKLRIQITPEIIKKWYNKEHILDNALYALGKKHYDDSHDSCFSNIGLKLQYLNTILDIFGFKSLLDQDTVVESNNALDDKMENSKLMNKSYYSIMMKTFNKQEQAKDMNGKFKKNKFTKKCNCILNEFGFKVESNGISTKEKRKTKWIYQYKLAENMINIIEIINKY